MEKKRISGSSLYLLVLGVIALLCLAGGVWWLMYGRTQNPAPMYLLKDNAGHVALYSGDGSGPLAQYEEIYTRLLPESDVLALQQGVPVYSETELEKRLEDYGF
ncbi:hypothetical protein H6B10_05370 [Gemmiger formicilis]|uniref:hypothetical protein n=1 Tax=Gemmiger formicilis TaxID=745368 RepID=UPI00195ABE12|nr:hypothetical protein [Gemmiger formicilis]MBM6899134.1 hypothetical protein [Gemmiger formicilis]